MHSNITRKNDIGARRRRWSVLVALLASAGTAASAAAEREPGADEQQSPPTAPAERTAAAAARGAFLPFSQEASIEGRTAQASELTGYDSARHTGTFEAAAEVWLFGPIVLRGSAVYTNSDRTVRPSFGARLQALRERRHGVDGAVGVFYRPEGLTEPEGEIESVVAIGRHVGGTYILGNALYGQDPEGSERDGEVRLAALRASGGRFLFGVDGRVRFDLGSSMAKLAQHGEPTIDALVGPTASALLGRIALSAQGGASAFRMRQRDVVGTFVMIGIGVAL